MDVISLGKAMNTLRDIKELNDAIVGKEAEGHFRTADHRLDWIEGQADKMLVEGSHQINPSEGRFENLEYIDGKLKLKKIKEINHGVDYAVPIMTENDQPSPFKVSVSSTWSNIVNQGYHAFNRNESSQWVSGNSKQEENKHEWIQIDLGSPKKIVEYKLLGDYTPAGLRYPPNLWKIEGSDIGEFAGEQIILDNQENNKTNVIKTYNIQRPGFYRFYRLTSMKSDSRANTHRLGITRLDLFEEKNISVYSPQGLWTSPIIDLGIGWRETKAFNILKKTTEKNSIEIQIATSRDGMSFTDFKTLDKSLPQTRYLKIKAILSAEADIAAEDKQLEYNQSHEENIIALNEFTEAAGRLKLKTIYSQIDSSPLSIEEGQIFKFPINKSNFKRINKIEVN